MWSHIHGMGLCWSQSIQMPSVILTETSMQLDKNVRTRNICVAVAAASGVVVFDVRTLYGCREIDRQRFLIALGNRLPLFSKLRRVRDAQRLRRLKYCSSVYDACKCSCCPSASASASASWRNRLSNIWGTCGYLCWNITKVQSEIILLWHRLKINICVCVVAAVAAALSFHLCCSQQK